MAEIRELVLTFLERLSHNALPKNRKRETLDACIVSRAGRNRPCENPPPISRAGRNRP